MALSSLFETDSTEGLIHRQEISETFIGYVVNIFHPELDQICQQVIDCQSNLLLENLQASNHEFEQGFLIHEWSLESLKEILSPSKSLLLCLIDKNRQKLAGYQVLTPISNFIYYLDPKIGELELMTNGITYDQWLEFISAPGVRYLQQTGVAAQYHRQGVATNLTILAKRFSAAGICTDVLIWPHNNLASHHFKVKNGFQCIGLWQGDAGAKIGRVQSKVFIWPPPYSDS